MNKTSEYTTFIEPRLQEIFTLCQKHEVPFIAVTALEVDQETGSVTMRTTNVTTLKETPGILTLIMMLLREQELYEAVIRIADLYITAKIATKQV